MISRLNFRHCDPSGIAINSSKSNDFKDCAPHRPNSRALDSVDRFLATPAPEEPVSGYIYLICSEHQDAGKLGWATDPAARLAKAQTNNPAELTLFGAFPASRAVEGELHAALDALRIRGEWFRGVDQLESVFRELEDLSGAREFDGESPEITAEDVRTIMHRLATMPQA